VVMIMNPVLYYLISKTVDSNIRGSGMYTDQERLYAKTLRSKFFSIILVFFVCWSPNLLNGLFLFLGTKAVPLDYYIALWNYMALVNPLQAFLNSILYRNVGGCWSYSSVIDTRYKPHSSTTGQINFSGFEESSEESPLLSFRWLPLELKTTRNILFYAIWQSLLVRIHDIISGQYWLEYWLRNSSLVLVKSTWVDWIFIWTVISSHQTLAPTYKKKIIMFNQISTLNHGHLHIASTLLKIHVKLF